MNEYRSLAEAREVCPTTTRRMIDEGAVLVDLREPAEISTLAFDAPEVITIPLGDLAARFAEIPRDRSIVMVCKVGERSLKATYFMMYQGYDRVANMAGGIEKWTRKGFPVKGDPASLALGAQSAGSCCSSAAGQASTCCAPNEAEGKAASACC